MNIATGCSWLSTAPPRGTRSGDDGHHTFGTLDGFEYSCNQRNPWAGKGKEDDESSKDPYFPPTSALRAFRYYAGPPPTKPPEPRPQCPSRVSPSCLPPAPPLGGSPSPPHRQPLTPPSRSRNRHNSVYGQLPIGANSPAIARRVFGRADDGDELSRAYESMVSGSAAPPAGHHLPGPSARTREDRLSEAADAQGQAKPMDDPFGDDDDDLFAEMDLDKVIEEKVRLDYVSLRRNIAVANSSAGRPCL